MGFWYKFWVGFFNFVTKYFYNLKIIHIARMADVDGCIIAPNHIRASDPPFLGSIFRRRVFSVAKKELFDIPLMGRMISYLDAIPIRRGAIDRHAIGKAKAALNEGFPLLMFPEGTRKSSTAKPGIGKIAYETNSDIVPVFIQYPRSMIKAILRRDSLKFVLGEKILIRELPTFDNRKDAYRYIAKYTLEKILELEDEC
ncbi:MAG: lysophospholipid acyltransferase family protein [Candidatus Cloacimonadales bacterium]